MAFHVRLATAALVAVATPASAAVLPSDDPILYWNDQALALLGGSTPIQSRSMAMLNVAMFDAVNAAQGGKRHAYLTGVGATGGDTRAAASQAAHNVLVAIDPTHAATYDAALATSLALVADGTAKTRGVSTGNAFAGAMLAARATDGSGAVVTYTPTGLPGDWTPTPPAFAPASLPQWGGVTPFLLGVGDQFRSVPPPALGSAAYAAAYNEVKDIGSAASVTRTADQTDSAKFWASNNASFAWMRVALGLAEGDGKSTLDTAATFAQLSVAMADAQIAVYNDKYFYRLWRPVTAIRSGDLDGNGGTVADPDWTSLLNTPAFPSYVSAHSALSEAAALTLGASFGDGTNFCLTLSFGSRCFANLTGAATDASDSRIWGGIHYRFDTAAGLVLGTNIGDWVLDARAFSAAPEPSTWAMLVFGFGLAGWRLRRRAVILAA